MLLGQYKNKIKLKIWEIKQLNTRNYQKYISEETMMGPNSVRILEELLEKYPLHFAPDDHILDLGCGTGLTSLVLARETGARVFADDLWIRAEENEKRFVQWGVEKQIIPVREDANDLHFDEKQFKALVSIDSYHYFGGHRGFFREKILPFVSDDGVVLIGIPGLKEQYRGRAKELLSDWLGEDATMFKSPSDWKELIGDDERIGSVNTWEMTCFDLAWQEWLASDNQHAQGDRPYFESVIRPYTCFVGICIRLKKSTEEIQ